jgi:Kelch motif
MKKKSTSQSAFFNVRVLFAAVFCLGALAVALFAQTKGSKQSSRSASRQDAPGTQRPDVMQMVGPVRTSAALRDLPHVPPQTVNTHKPLPRYPRGTGGLAREEEASSSGMQKLLENIFRPIPRIPPPLLTFDGINSAESACGCLPPDTQGDVGPNHYVEVVNTAFRVYNKDGTPAAPVTQFDTLFAPLVGTPCSGLNAGDPFVLYDHQADRWLLSDFAFAGFPGPGPFFQCIAVSTSPDPAGTYNLYALQHDPNNLDWLGDYPKFAAWDSGGATPQNSYVYTINLFDGVPSIAFAGVRVYALDRASMIAGGPANAISFFIPPGPTGLGDSYSLVPAYFRAGNPPPAGRDQMLLDVDSPFNENTTLTEVKGWILHVDFATPGNSTLGIGTDHAPNALITVDPFVEAWTNAAGFQIVPQQGTANLLDTLGDKIMTPVVYRFDGGTESLWADQTVMVTFPAGPSAIRWYQFDVTGGTFPATPAQQQTFDNAGDGLWRFMPSIAADQNGNVAIGYSVSDETIFPGIRYAGRLSSDPPNDLGQGEATMTNGGGAETHPAGRWGDYTYTSIDPSDMMTFWHVNEYFVTTSSANWATRIGKFDFVGGPTPTPTPTATPGGCSWAFSQDLPSPGVRFVGVFFPANGKFYAMGGRAFDGGGGEFVNPFEYDPVTGTWTTKAATYPDNQTNNMACGVLNDAGTDYIYCAGGSESATSTTTGRVFRYDPVADVITPVAGPWPPGAASILPGGFSVFNNQLFILGGFDIPLGEDIDQIWEFTPGTNTWLLQTAVLPVPRGYIPTCTIGSLIYTGGGTAIDGGGLTDAADSFVYDPVADSIATIASIPRPTGETRALNFNGKMYVMGGGRTPPNPSNQVDVYDPVTNTWSTDLPFSNARRNFATDTNGTDQIWLAGGYDVDGVTPLASTEVFTCPVGTPTPTPTVTPTPTPGTPTPTPSVTVTPTPRPSPTPRPRGTPRPRP